ncbi:hypothetical protein SS1G_00649 [Sclerotinia sclerotiorum 1980 UF-70]|uniref:2,6-dihydroxypyridine 3-monooxygenase substrate binding domain-containing protein n=2 Tax=Sclerotinia sclerotiorum (strain ATCC 18683 / 1980 / Ss-1) TaxID=665079 RepID=A0A1D9PYI9_SCLS1|nr:hypothetical protein SS1G_00649 [Sclerotinia sclerotiorum 1980 UF-70]APA07764.1 hypothetical protein sscle_03g025340 [Sclerotinia sclerotiorum 1980 UF-70]EDN91246.1 hypothetical protein SS1G_00649 [Sclerotinia sclerotiorum 1980 UF-70]
MTEKPLNVVIVGGSLTALFHGIVLRRLGHHVRILERNNPSQQMSLGAGIAAMEHVQSFMRKYDETKTPYCVTSPDVQYLDQAVKIKSTWKFPMATTSWKILYYVMRANFDGLASDLCVQVPQPTEQQGSATYDHEKEVTSVEYKDELVTVQYRDTGSDSHATVHADLVIAADGASSGLRQNLQPLLQQKYAGYVAWRGVAAESEISEETKAVFACKATFFVYKGGYIVLYTIPGEDGNLSPGHRQLNWVWYNIHPENSQEYRDIMTDIDGHRHRTTLPIGKVTPQNWEKQKALALQILPAPFAEMVQKTTKPFISAIHDREIAKPSLFNGKLLFVGDALATFRPHVASSTNQAALDAQLLEQLMKGEITAAEWEDRVLAFANFTAVRSELWGAYYVFGVSTLVFVRTFLRYWKMVAVQAFWRRIYG